jgi:hypothetical protein
MHFIFTPQSAGELRKHAEKLDACLTRNAFQIVSLPLIWEILRLKKDISELEINLTKILRWEEQGGQEIERFLHLLFRASDLGLLEESDVNSIFERGNK